MMMNFDAAGREACVVRELRTNTPLQSLNLMNDVTFLEAARKMAERMMREGGSSAGGADRVWIRAGDGAPAERPRIGDPAGNFRYYRGPISERSGSRDTVSDRRAKRRAMKSWTPGTGRLHSG